MEQVKTSHMSWLCVDDDTEDIDDDDDYNEAALTNH